MSDIDRDGIGLAEAIEVIRAELQQAATAGAQQPIAFRPTAVELSLEVAFERTAGADAGVRVWVVSLGGKGEVRTAHTQRITVQLEPLDRASGTSPLVSDQGRH